MKIDPNAEALPMLRFYSGLAKQLSNDAQGVYLQANALGLQIDATIISILRAAEKKKRWWQVWKRG